MQVKTFRGPNTQTVLRQIKAELGADAVILSTQTIKDRGKNICEATAAVEAPEPPPSTPSNGEGGSSVPGWNSWHSEWSRFKEQLLTLIRPQIDFNRLTPRQRLILEYLEKEGVHHEGLLTLWETFKNAPGSSNFKLLTSLVSTRPFEPSSWSSKFHALTGPHGVGKTSTVLRLALSFSQDHRERICLANADMEQGKGRIFLRHYAELSGFDYRELCTIEDWLSLKKEKDSYDRIFIDLPGLGKDAGLSSWWKSIGGELLSDVGIHLCLSPHFRAEQIRAFRDKYMSSLICSTIWTKLDEACNYGALVDEGIFTKLPISALTYGPGLKNSWSPARDENLWKLILKHTFPPAQGQ